MAKSKATLRAEYYEIGGNPADIPDNLEDITADDILELIQNQQELNRLQEQLKADAAGNAGAGAEEPQTQPEKQKDEPKEAPKETPPVTPEAQPPAPLTKSEGKTFTLTACKSWSAAKLPGKRYDAGVPFVPETEAEARVLRSSGRFTEV